MSPTTYTPVYPVQPVSAMRPLPTYDDRAGDASRDFAAAGKFSLYALERMLTDCVQQPQWRLRAKLCAGYYDGKQVDEVRRQLLLAEDVDERVVNLIRPIVNSVLGQEAKSRTDIRLEADSDDYADVAEVISMRLKEAERETYAHQAVSNAYGSMVKKGLGWLHVCRNSDPLAYPYRFEDVSLDEVWWDWRGQTGPRLDDRCRWLARMRMIDLDEVIAGYPDKREVLERSANGWDDFRMDASGLLGEPDEIQLVDAFDNERRFNTMYRKWDWIDTARKMVKLVEVWYRVPATAVCLRLSPTRTVPYNAQDPRHVEAVSRGLVKVVKGVTSQVRRALYAGPHRLMDEGTTRKSFPYIPMFAYRDDADGSPYGLVDGMIAPQDDYNDRRHRIQWLLKSRQLWMDSDAVDPEFNSIKEVADAINRPDLVAILNPLRRNGAHAVRLENALEAQKEQFELLTRDEDNIQKAAGRYGSNLGNAQVQSGIANSLLIEQGEQSMGEMNDNYTYARRSAFEALVDLIVEDHSGERLAVPIGQGSSKRVVVLNDWQPQPVTGEDGQPVMQPKVDPTTGQPVVDPATGQPAMEPVMGPPMPVNMVSDATIVTGMAETPNTPAARMQTQQQLKEIIAALGQNPQALALLAPVYLEATSVDNRKEVANDLRRMSGLPLPGDRAGRQAAEQQQQQTLAKQQALNEQTAVANLDKTHADTALKQAQTHKTTAEAQALERRNAMGHPEAEAAALHLQNAATIDGANDQNAAIDGAINDAMGQTA
jgi:hypothetical protein